MRGQNWGALYAEEQRDTRSDGGRHDSSIHFYSMSVSLAAFIEVTVSSARWCAVKHDKVGRTPAANLVAACTQALG